MSKYEEYVCNIFLSNFPTDASIDEVFEIMRDEGEAVVIWEPFEHRPIDDLIYSMETSIIALKEGFVTRRMR